MDNFLYGWWDYFKGKYKLNAISYSIVNESKYSCYFKLDNGQIIAMKVEDGYPYDIGEYDLMDSNYNLIKSLGKSSI